MLEEAEFYEKIDENSHTLQCNLCGRHCKIADKQFGFCKSRKNVKGEMRLVNYSKIASYHKDPIEKIIISCLEQTHSPLEVLGVISLV